MDHPLPNRRSIRLPEYDYANPGAYFVTVCAVNRRCLFGSVQEDMIELNGLGKIVEQTWLQIPEHFARVTLDEIVVMPNHVHGIVLINAEEGDLEPLATHASPLHHHGRRPTGPGKQSFSAIVGSFKSAATRTIRHRSNSTNLNVWQRGFYRARHSKRAVASSNSGLHPRQPIKMAT